MRQRNVKNKNEILNNSSYIIREPEQYLNNWQELFKNNNPIHIEIGMGKGQFISQLALKNTNINFIGIEKFDSILALAVKKVPDNLPNLKLIRMDASDILNIFKKEIDTLYLNFSDPWPKKRHAKRRLTSPEFLKKYDEIFHTIPHIIMKTDNKDLFSYSIKTLNNHGYYINDITFDLKSRVDIDNIFTEYEEKFTKLNNPIYRIDVVKSKK